LQSSSSMGTCLSENSADAPMNVRNARSRVWMLLSTSENAVCPSRKSIEVSMFLYFPSCLSSSSP